MITETTDTNDSNTSGEPTQPKLDALIESVAAVYRDKGKDAEFADESAIYKSLVPKLLKRITPAYIVQGAFKMGSTATVWKIYDRQLRQMRALKLARPRLSKLRNIIIVLRGESDRLATLNHQNIIKIYGTGEIPLKIGKEPYSFPFFIMEFLEGVKDVDEYILSHLDSLSGEAIIAYFRDLVAGISFLHEQSIIHCDIKPGNLLIAPDKAALVADLGYSKHLPKPLDGSKETQVSYTPHYAHPDLHKKIIDSKDSAANIAKIPHNELRAQFDLFAFGRSLQEILLKIRQQERSNTPKPARKGPVFTPYQWAYLGYISKRLLDGLVVNRANDEFNSDAIGGLPDGVMRELRYETADDALETSKNC